MYRDKVIKIYGKSFVYPMSAIRDEELFRSFLESMGKVDVIIETGTHAGLSSMVLSEFANVVHTFDVIDHPLRQEIWDKFKISNAIFHHIKDNVEKEKIINGLDFQFAFLDGNHHGVRTDFLLTNRCGSILFHDYQHGFPADNCRTMVVNFVDTLIGIVRIDEPFALWGKHGRV